MDSQFWNDEFKGNPDHVNVADRVLAMELENLEPGTALDLGCGSGKNALMLARRGWAVVGVDWADHAISLAGQAASREDLRATFIVADTTTWRADGEFDLVISTYALPGREESPKVLATAVHAVAPGGTLLIVEWNRTMAEVWPFDEEELTTPEEIVSHLSGFDIERAEVRRIEIFTAEDPRAMVGTEADVVVVRARRRLRAGR